MALSVNLSSPVSTEYTPALLRTLGASNDLALLLGILPAACYAAAALLAGRAVDRAGRRAVLLAGSCTMVVAQASWGGRLCAARGWLQHRFSHCTLPCRLGLAQLQQKCRPYHAHRRWPRCRLCWPRWWGGRLQYGPVGDSLPGSLR